MINPKDYTNYTEYLVDVLRALDTDGQVYVNKAEYDLDRTCDQEDYFINLLGYVDSNNENTTDINLDYNPFPGFETFDPPEGTFTIGYLNGLFTGYDGATVPTSYVAGETVSITMQAINDNAPLDGLQITLTVTPLFTFLDLAPIVVTFVYTAETPSVNVTFPVNYAGPVTVTSVLTDAQSQPIITVPTGTVKDLGDYTGPEALPVFDTVLPANWVVPNIDTVQTSPTFDIGALAESPFYGGEQANSDSRFDSRKFLSTVLGSEVYHPALNGATLSMTFDAETNTYTYKPAGADTTTGAPKTLDRLVYNVRLQDEDGSPVAETVVDGPAKLAAEEFTTGQESQIVNLTLNDGFVGALFALITVEHAYNNVQIAATGNNVPGLTFSMAETNGLCLWEPGDTVTVNIAVTSVDGAYNDTPLYNTIIISVMAFDTSEATGSAVYTLGLPQLIFPGSAQGSFDLTTPSSGHDGDMWLSTVVFPSSIPSYINELNLYFDTSDPVQLNDIATVSLEYDYWDITQPDTAISLTIVMDDGFSEDDYIITLIQQSVIGNAQIHEYAVSQPLALNYNIVPGNTQVDGQPPASVELSISIVAA